MKRLILTFFVPFLFSCQHNKKDFKNENVTIADLGKINYSYEDISLLSKEFDVDIDKLTSCLYIESNNENLCYPINDLTFNYDEYEKKKKENPLDKFRASIIYKTKTINSKKVNLVYHLKIKSN